MVEFIDVERFSGDVVCCRANSIEIGRIIKSFAGFAFYPAPVTTFDAPAMRTIADKLDELNHSEIPKS